MASRDDDKTNPRIDSKAGTLGKPTTGKGVWSGEAVARAPDGEAEQKAMRAEGNAPVSGREAVEQNRFDVDKHTRRPPSLKKDLSREELEASARLKQEAAAEGHRRVQAERGLGPHGKL